MAIQEKQLGQARPGDTNAVSLYSPAASTTAIIKTVIVCNTTGTTAAYRIFLDDDGTTYDQSTALFYDISLGGNATDIIDVFLAMDNSSGNLAIRTDTASALTFSCFGAEIT